MTRERPRDPNPLVYVMSPAPAALATVQTSTTRYAVPEHTIVLTGKIAVDERKRAVITANYAGRIETLGVDFTGQHVRKGQLLATIYAPELVTAQKELLEAAKYQHVNPALYTAAREKLRLWKITERQIAAIETTEAVLTEFEFYADISGVVLSRRVSTGDYVSRGSVLFEIADLSAVWVLMDAYESDLPWVHTGGKVQFEVAATPGRKFASKVTFIDPFINPQTRTAAVRAEVQNSSLELKPEMFVNATIEAAVAAREKALLIPKTAILWTAKRSVVYVKSPNSDFPAFEMREVTIGPRAGDVYVIAGGLEAGEEVVTYGVFAVDGAAQLSGHYSMMNRPASRRIPILDAFRQQTAKLIGPYFELKNALVKGDSSRARSAARALLAVLQSVDRKGLEDKDPETWMALKKDLQYAVKTITEAEGIEDQRRYFVPLSEVLIEIAELFGIESSTVYVQYCPMALDNQGTYWLSNREEIANPYFGEAMLRCGEVRKEIHAGEKVAPPTPRPHPGHSH